MSGDIKRARRLLRMAKAARAKIGNIAGSMSHHEAFVEMLAGKPARAAARLRSDFEKLDRFGERAALATTAALLAQAVYALGELAEAERLCLLAKDIAAPDDIVTHIIWRRAHARLLADAGSTSSALPLAREAVRLAASTDMLTDQADALFDLAHVLRAAGELAEARKTLRAAGELYALKGNVPGMGKTAAKLAAGHEGSLDG
jgi:ATP/maltotriose-dependent transcriptional regulator MalT